MFERFLRFRKPVYAPLEQYTPQYYKQSFVRRHEFIMCKFDPKLALSVNSFGRASLAKFNPLDANQKWNVNSRGQLYPKSMVDHVLTVLMPVAMPGDEEVEDGRELYVGAEVLLQPASHVEFGCAHQKWSFDEKLGFFDAFATDQLDISE